MPGKINSVALCCLVAGVYFLAGKVGLLLAFEQGNTSPVWPPTGIAIGALLHFGYRCWPGILAGAFFANMSTEAPVAISASIAVGNTLEAVVAFYLIKRLVTDFHFHTIFNVIIYSLVLMPATAISATVGIVTLVLGGLASSEHVGSLWATWWIGDMAGGLVAGPLVLAWLRPACWQQSRGAELLILIATLCFSTAVVFSEFLFHSNNYPLAFILLPITFWAALRFGLRCVTSLIALLTTIAIYGTISGYGPFVRESANESLLLLHSFIATVVMVTLILAASREERQRSHEQLRNAHRDLEQRVATRTHALAQANEALRNEVAQRELTTGALQTLLTATAMSGHDEFLRTSVKALGEIYNTRYAYIGVFSDDRKSAIRSVAVWDSGSFARNFEYSLKGTPCRDALDSKAALVCEDAARRYPEDSVLTNLSVQSYYGAPLMTPDKTMLGIVAVMHTHAMELQDWVKPVLGILANRIALQIQREETDSEIRLAESVFNDNVEAIIVTDASGLVLRINPAFERITGYTTDDAVGHSHDILKSGAHDDNFYAQLWQDVLRDGSWQGEIWHRHKDGKLFPAWQTVTMVSDETGKPANLISIFSDISDKKKTEEQIYRLAHYDALTQLPNRASFRGELEKALTTAERHNDQLALIFFDIDNFKLINDTLGHQAGDELLVEVARRLVSIVRKEDMVSRLGGDEFTILLTDVQSGSDAAIVARKILSDLRSPMTLEHGEVHITVSIGISTFPNDGKDADNLLKHADAAMYRAKEQGRNNFQFFTGEMHTRAIERMGLEKAMRRALDNNEFVLYYQPQVDTLSGEITSWEALVRWQHPDKGLVMPDRFISIAEENGLIVDLGAWIMEAACRQYRDWGAQGVSPRRIAVNISPRQLHDQNFLAMIRHALDRYGVSPEHIELELTESMFMDHVDDCVETLRALRAMGIQLSIDDFGTGYSSMAYLKQFPINKLKIDRSFVEDLVYNTDDAAIVSATIAMGHGLNLRVTAEGVQSSQQLAFLREHGCDEVQGHFFSPPLTGEEARNLIQSGPLLPDTAELARARARRV